jgi:hypothetical protein
MDNYKQLKKLERSFEGKLTRKLNNLFKLENVEFNIKGFNGYLQFNSKETGWTLFTLEFIKDEDYTIILGFIHKFQIYTEIPVNVLEKKQMMLDIVNKERELYEKLKWSLEYENNLEKSC